MSADPPVPEQMPFAAGRLVVGETYTPEQLSDCYGFKPFYLRTAGGMVPVPAKGVLLLVTHAQREVSFEYGDYWSGDHLIYTGRGQVGDQKLEAANLDVAQNRRQLHVFEHVGKYQRRFLGAAQCTNHWRVRAPDRDGSERTVLQFCLSFNSAVELPRAAPPRQADANGGRVPSYERRPRPFDEAALPTVPALREHTADPGAVSQLMEKAIAGHHQLLVALKLLLVGEGWIDIEEIPSAVDLWARKGGVRVIFEAKTISRGQELHQARAALAQLLEYRFFHGRPEDRLCLVSDEAVSQTRLRFLNSMGVSVMYYGEGTFHSCGEPSMLLA
jgi:hypothetical protein